MAGVALANMDWVSRGNRFGLKGGVGAGVLREYRAEAYRHGSESLRGRRRPTVIPVTSAAEVLIRGWRRACQHGLGRSRGNRFGSKGGVRAGVRRESRAEAYRYGGESLRGQRRPTVNPVTSAAEVLIRGWRRACQYGLGRSRGNRFGLKGGVGAGVRRLVSAKGLPAQRCLSQGRQQSVTPHRRAAIGYRQS